jgi:tetratricopeptide (TPR) repeat protein
MVDKSYKYDVFISYSHKDEDWVVYTLLPRLEAAGAKVCIDYRDFTPGKPSRHNMRDSIKSSRFVALVMTPAWVASEWTLFESLLALADDPAGQKQRTIPLMVEKCDVPEDISILTWIDFCRSDRMENAWRQLLTATGRPLEIPKSDKKISKEWNLVHPYGMSSNFTGRQEECGLLNEWLSYNSQTPLFVLRAIGGFGKSALAWYWLMNDVKKTTFHRVMWWSFYEGDASFDNFLDNALSYLILDKREIPNGFREKVELLVRLLREPGTLIVMDGFERALRAFHGMGAAYQGDDEIIDSGSANDGDCMSPFAELFLRSLASMGDQIQSKVLITTRLTPHILETGAPGQLPLDGWVNKELSQMKPADAVEFFEKQGIRGSRVEIESACEPYGYHPLSLRLLSGLILSDLVQPGDIAIAKRLDVSGNIRHRQHHVLEQAYNTLNSSQKKLLGRIACFRSGVPYEALRALEFSSESSTKNSLQAWNIPKMDATDPSDFESHLADLIGRGLLHRSDPSPLYPTLSPLYDLHPIVRRYVYDRLTSSDRDMTHIRLVDYFDAIPKPTKVQKLEDLNPLIELYHHTVRAKKWTVALNLYTERLNTPLYFQFGAYQLIIDILSALNDSQSKISNNEDVLRWLANAYNCIGQPEESVELLESALEKPYNETSKIFLLQNLSTTQIGLGLLRTAESNLRSSILLCSKNHKLREAVGHQELGRILAYRGKWNDAKQEFDISWQMFEELGAFQARSLTAAYQSFCALLMAREKPSLTISKLALDRAQLALDMAREYASKKNPVERDFVDFHWLLGVSLRINENIKESEIHLSESLGRCRAINLMEVEAGILLDIARLRHIQCRDDDALRIANEALTISERSNYVLQSSDIHLFLAEMALKVKHRNDIGLKHAQMAKAFAACEGRDYVYQVAYNEAVTLLANTTAE